MAVAAVNASVLMTGFAKDSARRRIVTLHVANLAAPRRIVIEGVPEAGFRVIRTNEGENFREMPAMRPQSGALRFEIPARTLLTLTTMPR